MPTKWLPTTLALGTYLLGILGAGFFIAYVLGTGTGFWPRRQASDSVVAWLNNLGWLGLFAVQHSGMARQSFKRWWTRWVPDTLERTVYVATSSVVLAGLTLCWQTLPGEPLWCGPGWIFVFSFFGALGIGLCCLRFDPTAFFGLRQASTGSAKPSAFLDTTGPYRFVRHPLMLSMLLALWAQPIMPPELLLLNVGLTLYTLIGIHFEERDLLERFGAEYETYRRNVPALLPFPKQSEPRA